MAKTPAKKPAPRVVATAGLSVQFRPIGDLRPYSGNARTHSDAQVAELVASVRRFGWTNPVLVDSTSGILVAGHGRLMAARAIYEGGGTITFPGKAGVPVPAGTIPAIDCAGWSDDERRAYTLADNQLALRA